MEKVHKRMDRRWRTGKPLEKGWKNSRAFVPFISFLLFGPRPDITTLLQAHLKPLSSR
jgi:hypothetical protein